MKLKISIGLSLLLEGKEDSVNRLKSIYIIKYNPNEAVMRILEMILYDNRNSIIPNKYETSINRV